jgi:hypothetical protein
MVCTMGGLIKKAKRKRFAGMTFTDLTDDVQNIILSFTQHNVFYDLDKAQFYYAFPLERVFQDPTPISAQEVQPQPVATMQSIKISGPCVRPVASSLVQALWSPVIKLAVISTDSARVYPLEAKGWADERIGSQVKRLSIGTFGGGLNLNAVNHLTGLETLKLHSIQGGTLQQRMTNEELRAFFYCTQNTLQMLENRRAQNEFFNETFNSMLAKKVRLENELATWIANLPKLKSLKVQFLNILPADGTCKNLENVRLRRCDSRLFWHYVQLPAIQSLCIEEPTSLRVILGDSREHTIPNESLGDKGLREKRGRGQRPELEHNLLEPLPRNMAASAAKITSLSLCAFRVDNNDLTALLTPFTGLTSLSLAATIIRILPSIQTLETLVLRDVRLVMTTHAENVYKCICGLRRLVSLTLDSVVDAESLSLMINARAVYNRNDPDDPEDIDNCVKRVGINTTVQNLTLGIERRSGFFTYSDIHARYTFDNENINKYKVMLQRMFPNVCHLGFVFNPIDSEDKFITNSILVNRPFDFCQRIPNQRNTRGQRFFDDDSRCWDENSPKVYEEVYPFAFIFRGWEIKTVKVHIKRIVTHGGMLLLNNVPQTNVTVPLIDSSRYVVQKFAHHMQNSFKSDTDLQISIGCGKAERSTSRVQPLFVYDFLATGLLFDDENAAKTTIKVAPYSGVGLKEFYDLYRLRLGTKLVLSNGFRVSFDMIRTNMDRGWYVLRVQGRRENSGDEDEINAFYPTFFSNDITHYPSEILSRDEVTTVMRYVQTLCLDMEESMQAREEYDDV